jgi:hypothetical protein
MKKRILLLGAMAAGLGSFAQTWAPAAPNTLFSRNSANNVSPIFVGIGLNNPYSLLQVHSGSGDNQIVVSGNAPSIRFQQPSSALSGTPSGFGVPYAKIGLSTGVNNFCDGSTSGDLVIQTVDNTKSIIFSNKFIPGNNGVEQMRLNAAGFLGIGTASPETKLHVRGGDISIDRNKSMIFGSTVSRDGNGEYIRNSRDLSREGMPDSIYGLSLFAGYIERIRINYDNGFVGIGTTNPKARLEIKDGRPNQSGLRFTNLNSGSSTVSNPGKVLSLNSLGDVILVPSVGTGAANANNGLSVSGTNVQLGRVCDDDGNSAADLSDNRAIPLNNHNVIFKDAVLNAAISENNRVGIGYFSNKCELQAKLQVEKQETTVIEDASIGILSHNSDAMDYHIINERVYDETIAIKGIADAPTGSVNIGGDFIAKTEAQGIGVRASVEGTDRTWATAGLFSVPVSSQATGVQAFVSGQNYAIGVNGAANSAVGVAIGGQFTACGTTSIGIFVDACNSANNGAGPSYAGFFNGDVFSTGSFTASDKRLKKDIQPISNALELLGKIEPKKYQFDNSKYPSLKLSAQKENYGVIAQELEAVMPSLVKDVPVPGGKGFTGETIKSVNYTELIPVLIQAVKDQQKQIEELKAMIASKDNTRTTAAESEAIAKINIELSDKNVIVLGQNTPNPFSKSTAITFNLPKMVQHAVINFTSADGRSLKSVEVTARGMGVINVYANELSSGVYMYTLVADGKVVETKKMQIVR